MSDTASPRWSRWLPIATLASAVPADTCAAVIRDWSRRWLAQGALTLSGDWRPAAGGPRARAHVIAGELAVSFDDGEIALGEMIYGAPDNGGDAVAADRLSIAVAVSKATAELRRDLAKAHALTGEWSTGSIEDGEWVFATDLVLGSRRRIGTIAVGRELLVRRRLAIAAPAKPRTVVRPAEALAPQPLRLGARIGAATLPLRDLGSLCAGDVVLLDRAATEPLELTVDGRRVGHPCLLANTAGGLALQIH